MVDIIKDGKVVSRSRNLAGQLAYARRSAPVLVEIEPRGEGGAYVFTEYADGARSGADWASFDVAVDFYATRSRNRRSWFCGLAQSTDGTVVRFKAQGGAS